MSALASIQVGLSPEGSVIVEPLSEVPCIRSVTSQTVPEAPQDYAQDRVFCTLRYQKSSIDELA